MKTASFFISILLILTLSSVNANPIPDSQGEPVHSTWLPAMIAVASIPIIGVLCYYAVISRKHNKKIESEKIEFNVEPDGKVFITGNYHLRGLKGSKGKGHIFYPLPNRADSLIKVEINNASDVSVSPSNLDTYAGYDFAYTSDENYSADLAVTYRQANNGSNACRYILTSTKYWDQPIGKAVFIIRIPKDKKLSRCNFSYTDRGMINDKMEYEIVENGLDPKEDLEFAWR